jgi:hypothetical protein
MIGQEKSKWLLEKSNKWQFLVHCATYKNNNEGLTRFFPWLHKLARDGRSTTTTKKKKKEKIHHHHHNIIWTDLNLEKEREREMEGEKGRVCVTGGTGFVASWLIMKLLEQGYSVNTTVRPHPGKFSIYLFPLMLGQMKNFNIIKLIHWEIEGFCMLVIK